jgi:hypothetical protein
MSKKQELKLEDNKVAELATKKTDTIPTCECGKTYSLAQNLYNHRKFCELWKGFQMYLTSSKTCSLADAKIEKDKEIKEVKDVKEVKEVKEVKSSQKRKNVDEKEVSESKKSRFVKIERVLAIAQGNKEFFFL